MTSYPFFSRWRPLDLIWVMLDHPWSAIVGISWWSSNLVLIRFIVLEILRFFIFCSFGLILPIHAHFGGGLGAYFPQMMSPTVLTPEKHFLAWKHVVWAIKHVNRFSGSTWACSREKRTEKDRTGQDSQTKKSQSGNIPLYGEKPPLYRLEPKFAWWVASLT